MKWYAISGSWRTINDAVKLDVETIVTEITSKRDGIVTGGALGVDYTATETVLRKGDVRKQIRIYLPIKLEDFCKHYWNRAREGVISEEQARLITEQLQAIHKLSKQSIIDKTRYALANEESYYARNLSIVKDSDGLYAFQVNDSKGTQDAIDKARLLGKQVVVKKYSI
jgi:hypothetical protein